MEFYSVKWTKKINPTKYFYLKNRKLLLIGVLIGFVVSVVSWNFWKSYQVDNLQESAKAFLEISSQLQTGSEESLIDGKRFANETKDIYGVLINIELAKILVEKNDFLEAEKVLLKALEITKLDDLKDLLNIRLARIQIALSKEDQALATLTKVKNQGWTTVLEDIRGDVFLKNGDLSSARAAYSTGINSNGSEIVKTLLKIKINSLPN